MDTVDERHLHDASGETMVSLDLSPMLEKRLKRVVQDHYQGDLQAAISAFLVLHEKYGWKEQLRQDVEAIRTEVRRQGGIRQRTIDDAIKQYRKQLKASRG
jgi:hypothetical protein